MTLTDEMIPKVVERLKALADESRVRLLLRLRKGPCNVGALVVELNMNQASVSKHLSVLRQAGLVQVQRRGTQAVYRIRDASVFDMCQIVCQGVMRHIKQEHALITNPGRRIR